MESRWKTPSRERDSGVDQRNMEHSRVEHFNILLFDNDGFWDTSLLSIRHEHWMPDLHVCNLISVKW